MTDGDMYLRYLERSARQAKAMTYGIGAFYAMLILGLLLAGCLTLLLPATFTIAGLCVFTVVWVWLSMKAADWAIAFAYRSSVND